MAVKLPQVLQELGDEGTEITLKILAGLAPFRTAHMLKGVSAGFDMTPCRPLERLQHVCWRSRHPAPSP